MGRRVEARKADKSEAWRAQLWIQMRWKTEKQTEVQDQVGWAGRIRSRHMRHERAPEDDEVRKDWILERSVLVADDRPVNSKYDRKMESERSEWRTGSDPDWLWSESVSESEWGEDILGISV